MVMDPAENQKESQSSALNSQTGKLRPGEGKGLTLFITPELAHPPPAALRPQVSVNRQGKSFVKTQRPLLNGPTQVWHRDAQSRLSKLPPRTWHFEHRKGWLLLSA